MPDTHLFQLGRTEATYPIGYKGIERYVTSLPDAPATFDHTNGFDGFHMLGNGPDPTQTVHGGKSVGDCAFVGTVNVELIDSLETDRAFVQPGSNEVVTDYLKYNHGKDRGCNLSQLLAYWHRIGLPWAGKLPAYANLSLDWDTFWAGVNAFGNGYIGIVVTATMMSQTQAQEPWDLTGLATDNQVLGGHCVVPFAREGGDVGAVATWGLRQKFTKRWFQRNVEEAHIAITAAQLAAKGNGYGLDIEHLQSDLKSLAT